MSAPFCHLRRTARHQVTTWIGDAARRLELSADTASIIKMLLYMLWEVQQRGSMLKHLAQAMLHDSRPNKPHLHLTM